MKSHFQRTDRSSNAMKILKTDLDSWRIPLKMDFPSIFIFYPKAFKNSQLLNFQFVRLILGRMYRVKIKNAGNSMLITTNRNLFSDFLLYSAKSILVGTSRAVNV